MRAVLQRGTAILAVIAASLVFATAGLAQMPPSPWKKGVPFPEPDEELYGVTVGGKLSVIGGFGQGKARGANSEYAPATNSWTTLPSMPMPRHGVAGAVIGNRFHLVSGMITSAGAMAMLDPKLEIHTASHDVLELPAPGTRPGRCEARASDQGERPGRLATAAWLEPGSTPSQ